MSNDSLKGKAAKGMVWTSIQRFSSMGIHFVSGIILARLLTPADYGAIGMLTIFMLVSQTFIDGGFGSALIQKKRPTDDDYSTIFWWNIGMSLLFYSILFICAPFIASFYHMNILCPVLRVQAIVLLLGALNSVQANQLRKQFKFKTIAIISLSSTIIALVITIIMAYNGYGVWALVTQNIVVQIIPTVLYWMISSWRPLLSFSIVSFKELASFGIYMFLIHFISEICNNIQGLLIGRLYNANTMGYYSKAKSTEKLASTSISQALNQVTFPLYAELQNDRKALIGAIKKLTLTIAFVTFPMMMVLSLVSKPLFLFLYSDRWIESVPYFKALCFAGIAMCLQSVNLQAINAIGKSRTSFSWTIIKRGIGLITLFIGLHFWGIWGIMGSVIFNTWFYYIINAWLVSKHVGYKLQQQLLDLAPVLFVSIITYILTYCLRFVFVLNEYIYGIVSFITFTAVYVTMSYLFKLESMSIFLDTIRRVLKKHK